jgi:hypothetical protein
MSLFSVGRINDFFRSRQIFLMNARKQVPHQILKINDCIKSYKTVNPEAPRSDIIYLQLFN